MNNFNKELKKIVVFTFLNEDLSYNFYDEDESDDDILGLSYALAKQNGLYISSDKTLTDYVLDGEKVVAALFCSQDSTSFSFDVVVDENYRNQKIATKLINYALSLYKENKEIYGDDYYAEVEVVNPLLIGVLEKKGFTKKHKTQSGILMVLN